MKASSAASDLFIMFMHNYGHFIIFLHVITVCVLTYTWSKRHKNFNRIDSTPMRGLYDTINNK